MARLVILEFEDNDAAERFTQSMNNRLGPGSLPQASVAMAYADVIAVFAKPTKFCECPASTKKSLSSFGKSKKYGWYVHRTCGKPTARWAANLNWVLSLAKNLYPAILKSKDDDNGI
jgi:hypothetical protein